MQPAGLPLHAVGRLPVCRLPRAPDGERQVQHNRKMRLQRSGGEAVRLQHGVTREPTTFDLVRFGREVEPIRQDDAAPIQRRPDDAGDEVGPGGEHQKQLGQRARVEPRVERQAAGGFGHRRPARLPDFHDVHPCRPEAPSQALRQRGLARALGPLDGDKGPGHDRQPSVMIELVEPFWMPSRICSFTRTINLSKFVCADTTV